VIIVSLILGLAWITTACTTQGDEIFFHSASQKAARLFAMDLEILRIPATLASSAIAFEHLLPKPLIGIPVQAKPGFSGDG